jgi:hypothetical protein
LLFCEMRRYVHSADSLVQVIRMMYWVWPVQLNCRSAPSSAFGVAYHLGHLLPSRFLVPDVAIWPSVGSSTGQNVPHP